MTQIICVITKEYVLLASDRLLTHGDGPKLGQIFKDEECKLVSLCNTCGIGYTGLARLGGMPTHKWIATVLARGKCYDSNEASQLLIKEAPSALPAINIRLKRQTFILAGWAHFGSPPTLQSHICVVTNCIDNNLTPISPPSSEFHRRTRTLGENEECFHFSVGHPIAPDRAVIFERNMRRLVSRDIGMGEALRLLVAEVFATHERESTVGDKVLALCIPKVSAESQMNHGQTRLSGIPPHKKGSTFSYFDRDYNEYKQYGPTIVCGGTGMTDIVYENDPSKPLQSVSFSFISGNEQA